MSNQISHGNRNAAAGILFLEILLLLIFLFLCLIYFLKIIKISTQDIIWEYAYGYAGIPCADLF